MGTFRADSHWRDSARYARFWFLDCRAVFPLFVFLLHIRLWTFILAVVAVIFFALLERYGLTIPVFWRWLRSTLAGKRRMAIPWWLD